MARKSKKEEKVVDLTDTGLSETEGLSEIEITEVEAALESGEEKELIEEKKGDEVCEKPEEDKPSGKKSARRKKLSGKKEQAASETKPAQNTTKSEQKSGQQEQETKIYKHPPQPQIKAKMVKPIKKEKDPSVRSTFGLFYR